MFKIMIKNDIVHIKSTATTLQAPDSILMFYLQQKYISVSEPYVP